MGLLKVAEIVKNLTDHSSFCVSCVQCRIINLTEWNLDIAPRSVTTDGESVEVVWEDGHVSPYDKHWLLSRSFRSQSRDSYRDQIGTRDFKHKDLMFQIST